MGSACHIRLRDIRQIHQLVGEIRELGQDGRAWRRHMLQDLCRLTDCQLAFTMDVRGYELGQRPQILQPIEIGWPDDRCRQTRERYLAEGNIDADPTIGPWYALMQRRRFVSVLRQQLVDDGTWYASTHFNEVRRLSGFDSCVMSTYGDFGRGWLSGFCLNRPWRHHPLGMRELRLVRLFHLELLRVLRSEPTATGQLTPRLRQTLTLLLAGRSEKQVAQALSLSPHTVHDYVKAIHERLGVSSRAELLAHYMAQRGRIVPPPGLAWDASEPTPPQPEAAA